MARIPYLTELIPKNGLLFWHSLDQPEISAASPAPDVPDEQGNFGLVALSEPFPVWRELATGEKYIEFTGTQTPLKNVGTSLPSYSLKHLFVAAAFNGATFNDYNGLIGPGAAVNGILVGDTGTTKFVNFAFPSLAYRKSGLLYVAANMQAPVNNVPELLEWRYPDGFSLSYLQIGKDRDFVGRLWNGRFDFSIGYTRLLSDVEEKRIRLYANLRSRLWLALNQTLTFPSPEILLDGKPTYSRFYAPPLDFEAVTYSHDYDDDRKTFNQVNTLPPRRWQIELNNISAEKAQVCDAFWENVRKIHEFNFYDYKRGKTYSGVRIENYSREHDGHQSWSNNCRFELVKY